MKAKLLYFIILALGSQTLVMGQPETDTTLEAKKPVIFRDKKNRNQRHIKWAVEYKLRDNGWSIGLDHVRSDKKAKKNKDANHTVFHLGIGYIRGPREGKTNSVSYEKVKFGKINALYPIELSVGKRKPIGREAVYEGVGVEWEYKAGVLLGWVLPYQIRTAYGDIEEFTPATAPIYTEYESIYAGLGSFRELSFSNIQPGVRLESNIIFNYKIRKSYIISPSIGLTASFFTKQIPIMLGDESGPLFLDIHIGVEFGKFKWR